jgi:predicted small integral membrane protein
VASHTLSPSVTTRIGFVLVALVAAAFLLLFGVANLIHPEVPAAYHTQNTLVCAGVCALGLVLLVIAIVEIRRFLRQAGTKSSGAAP